MGFADSSSLPEFPTFIEEDDLEPMPSSPLEIHVPLAQSLLASIKIVDYVT